MRCSFVPYKEGVIFNHLFPFLVESFFFFIYFVILSIFKVGKFGNG